MVCVSTNPSGTSDVVAEIEPGTSRAFVDAAQRAKAAQRAWARIPAPVRGQVVGDISRLVEVNLEPLSKPVTREIGKPITEARGEVRDIVDIADFFAGEGSRLYGQTVAVPSWYGIPALLCGNPGVWKPAEYSAASARAVYDVFQSAGAPVGVTGPSEVGARIGELCGRHLQTPCLELGGKNPVVVTEDADLDLAVQSATVRDPAGDVLCGPLLTEKCVSAALPGNGFTGENGFFHHPSIVSGVRFRGGISAGTVSVDNSTSGAEAHLPFGGNGKSGNGSRQPGVWVLDQITHRQPLNRDHSGKLRKAQADTLAIEANLDFHLA